jgi:acylphosphatase
MASKSNTPTVKQLKAMAKAAKVKGYYRLNRAALLKALGLPADDARTVAQLRQEAMALKVKGWYRLTRDGLLKALAAAPPASAANSMVQPALDSEPNPYASVKTLEQARAAGFAGIDLGEPLLLGAAGYCRFAGLTASGVAILCYDDAHWQAVRDAYTSRRKAA